MNVAQPDVLCAEAPDRIERVFGTPASKRLSATHPCPGHTEVPKEQAVVAGPPRELPIELFDLLDEGLLHPLFLRCTYPIRLPRIGEGGYRNMVELNNFRLA